MVLEISNPRVITPPGTSAPSHVQTLSATVLGGPDEGAVYTFDNDFAQLSVGDVFYLRHTHTSEGSDFYSVADPYRLDILLALAAIFLLLVFAFGGIQGVRGLLSLAGSLALIFYLLLPGIIAGYSPVLVAIGVASLIIIVGSYITHGWNRTTTAAVLGMVATVIITGLAASYVVHAAQLSGYNSEDSTYLHFQFNGTIDLVGVLLGGILVGLLGVLYDIAIGQAVSVEELMSAGRHLTKRELYRKAIRIGREHIGALVNTLAIAYVGAALPLLLLFRNAEASVGYILNGEVFASEIVRILIGSIGLVLAVPITTLIAVYLIAPKERPAQTSLHPH
ncbi:MAG: YibE/F family protein [bacterium]